MQRRASRRYGATIACVGQMSMQAPQLPQWALAGASAGSARSTKIFAQEEHRTGVARQRQRVLAAPAQAGARGQLDFEHRRRVGEDAVTERADFGRQAFGQALQPRAQHLVVIAATRIHRDHGAPRVGKRRLLVVDPAAARVARQVVHARADHAHRARHQLGRPRALQAMRRHVAHAAVEARREPIEQALLGAVQIDLGDTDL